MFAPRSCARKDRVNWLVSALYGASSISCVSAAAMLALARTSAAATIDIVAKRRGLEKGIVILVIPLDIADLGKSLYKGQLVDLGNPHDASEQQFSLAQQGITGMYLLPLVCGGGSYPRYVVAAGDPNQVVNASMSPCRVWSPTQATYPSGRINTAVGAVITPSAGSSHAPT